MGGFAGKDRPPIAPRKHVDNVKSLRKIEHHRYGAVGDSHYQTKSYCRICEVRFPFKKQK